MKSVSLKKNVGVIHHVTVGRPLTLLAKNLYNALLYKAHRQLLEKERHEVCLAELTRLMEFSSHNTEVLKDALRSLVEARVEWNVLGDAGEEEWGVTSVLAEAKIRGGVCTYAYAPTMREKLANPEVYALIDLKLQRRFTSTHTWSLYENVVRYRGVGRTPAFSLDILLGLLGLNERKAYQEFKYLRRDILNPALEEINTKSDIEVRMLAPQRHQRRVVAVQFEVKERTARITAGARDAVRARLQRFGVDGQDADRALAKHTDATLHAILDDVERRMKAGSITRVRPYTVTVLRQFDGDVVPAVEQERATKHQAANQQALETEAAAEGQRQLQRQFTQHQAKRVGEEERALTEEECMRLQEEFVEHLRSTAPFAYDQYLRGGERSRLVQHELLAFKITKLLRPEEQSLDKWLASGAASESTERQPPVGPTVPAPLLAEGPLDGP